MVPAGPLCPWDRLINNMSMTENNNNNNDCKNAFQLKADHSRMHVHVFRYVRTSHFSLLWPWPWTDDLDVQIWPRYSEDVLVLPKHQKWSFWVKVFENYSTKKKDTCSQTDAAERITYYSHIREWQLCTVSCPCSIFSIHCNCWQLNATQCKLSLHLHVCDTTTVKIISKLMFQKVLILNNLINECNHYHDHYDRLTNLSWLIRCAA